MTNSEIKKIATFIIKNKNRGQITKNELKAFCINNRIQEIPRLKHLNKELKKDSLILQEGKKDSIRILERVNFINDEKPTQKRNVIKQVDIDPVEVVSEEEKQRRREDEREVKKHRFSNYMNSLADEGLKPTKKGALIHIPLPKEWYRKYPRVESDWKPKDLVNDIYGAFANKKMFAEIRYIRIAKEFIVILIDNGNGKNSEIKVPLEYKNQLRLGMQIRCSLNEKAEIIDFDILQRRILDLTIANHIK